jgi:BA14K-like protein
LQKSGKKDNRMKVQKSSGSVRKRVARVLGTGVLIFMYAFGMIATTGAFVTAGVSPAFAQRGRGGGGRGRGHWGGRGRGGGNVGLGIGLGIGAAVIGGAIAASQAEAARRQDATDYCMQRYRSFDPASMTYMGLDGVRHPCP